MQSQIIERFLDTPQARKIASDIEKEKEAKREAIRKRITALSREREAAVATTEPALTEARRQHQAALDAMPALRTALLKADTAAKRARGLHAAELAKLQKELGAIA